MTVKKLIMILALVATSAFAEPSFDQIQSLIGRQQYSAAEQGLEQIIKNHPNSAKAYYSMAQAQAGLGNLDKARYALNKATGLDPSLGFASESQVRSLQEAITPQVKKIEVVDDSHWFRNTVIALIIAGGLAWLFAWYIRRKEDEDDKPYAFTPVTPVSPTPSPVRETAPVREITPVATKSTVYKKPETPAPSYTPPVYSTPTPAPVAHTTVVNNSNDGLLTGMILGNMMSGHHHDHVIEKEVIREVPVKSYESPGVRTSSWDSDSISSSWDSDSSSSRSSSSSWSSSSSSDSSWSSSDSSSSSWDSGSSSSSSDW